MADGKPPEDPPTAPARNPPPYNAGQQSATYPPQGQPVPTAAYPPAPPGSQPPAHSVVVTTVTTHSVTYRDSPVLVQCPNCQNHVTSTCIYENGMLVWISVIVLLLFQLWMGCCLIPLCITGLKDVRHICPVCKFQLGIYKRI